MLVVLPRLVSAAFMTRYKREVDSPHSVSRAVLAVEEKDCERGADGSRDDGADGGGAQPTLLRQGGGEVRVLAPTAAGPADTPQAEKDTLRSEHGSRGGVLRVGLTRDALRSGVTGLSRSPVE